MFSRPDPADQRGVQRSSVSVREPQRLQTSARPGAGSTVPPRVRVYEDQEARPEDPQPRDFSSYAAAQFRNAHLPTDEKRQSAAAGVGPQFAGDHSGDVR